MSPALQSRNVTTVSDGSKALQPGDLKYRRVEKPCVCQWKIWRFSFLEKNAASPSSFTVSSNCFQARPSAMNASSNTVEVPNSFTTSKIQLGSST